MNNIYSAFVLFVLTLMACQNENKKTSSLQETTSYSQKFNAALDSIYNVYVSMSPVRQTYLGIKDRQDEWNISNDSMTQVYYDMAVADLDFIQKNFDPSKMDRQTALTYRMWINDNQQSINNHQWRFHNYPVNQMFGSHTWFPTFLMNVHQITNETDARAWLSRLDKIDVKIDELIHDLDVRTEKGILAPKFVYPYVINDCSNLIKGFPFEDSKNLNPIFEDFTNDINKIDSLKEEIKTELLSQAEKLLIEKFYPAYTKLIENVKTIEQLATEESGIWKLPNGADYYKVALQRTTTTKMTPEQIYETGMSEVKRIHKEMEKIAVEVGFQGDLSDFFEFMKNDEQFFYNNTDEGKQAYLDKNVELIDAMKQKLDELFLTKPKAKLEVRAVEAFREQSAGIAFYNSAAPDGSRPGYYYVNLFDMKAMPKYEMEALSFHEAIPGHHMQISIAQELEGLPKYRTREASYTSYSEGWGLYSEYIPKEIGFYTDPYSDFGRLSMELWRACRLVVDIGIHAKKWTREEGIAFYSKNTPAGLAECTKMVERHIVLPSQATAYKIGQLKILSLRNHAKDILGDLFDIREFHDVVLTNGPVPLTILEELVQKWIDNKQITKKDS